MPENLQCYFDVEHFTSELFVGDLYYDDGGYVFCINCRRTGRRSLTK